MSRKKSAQVNAPVPMPEMPMMAGQECARIAVDPNVEEGNKLREEADRALMRLLVHHAQHSTWRVESAAKALSALRSY